jgi:multisubunit Na+/H+ antiporter MnhB subunit
MGRPGSVALVLVLGTMLAASAILEGFWLDLRSPIAAMSQVLVIAVSTGALAVALRHEFGGASHRLRAARPH